jgi:hypothetical protein
MKRIALCIAMLGAALVQGQANAANYGTAGCGLGAMVWKDEPGKIQILAATVNNLVSPQTFAITSGTSNCSDEPKTASAMFINVNQVALRKEVSRGEGETIASLSKLLGCSSHDQLGVALQRNYDVIFPANDVSVEQINEQIHNTIRGANVSCAAVI